MSAKLQDKISTMIIYIFSGLIVLTLLMLIGYVLINGVKYININFLTRSSSDFEVGGGIGPQIFNSIYILILTLIISIPISMLAAIYLSEYASENKFTEFIKMSIEVLSSLPSIVVGLFGFLFFVIKLGLGFSILSGALALTIFNLPILVRVMEQNLKMITKSQRESSLGLGLTKWETTIFVLIPSALPGIITGIIISAGRIFGEAAALIYTSGQNAPALDFTNFNIFSQNSPLNIMRPAETMAVHIWKINSEGIVPDAEAISNGTAAVLVISILVFNIGARYFGNKIYKKMTS